MPAPFVLPDTCDIYDQWTINPPIAEDVPCRQVPRFQEMLRQIPYTGDQWYGATHWVDFDNDVFIQDPMVPTTNRALSENNSPWALVFVFPDGVQLVLVPIFVEDRFTNTERAYKRVYCRREQRVT